MMQIKRIVVVLLSACAATATVSYNSVAMIWSSSDSDSDSGEIKDNLKKQVCEQQLNKCNDYNSMISSEDLCCPACGELCTSDKINLILPCCSANYHKKCLFEAILKQILPLSKNTEEISAKCLKCDQKIDKRLLCEVAVTVKRQQEKYIAEQDGRKESPEELKQWQTKYGGKYNIFYRSSCSLTLGLEILSRITVKTDHDTTANVNEKEELNKYVQKLDDSAIEEILLLDYDFFS